MHLASLNRPQRVILIIGFGVALYIFGIWLTTPAFPANGWVGYAPLATSLGRDRFGRDAELILWLIFVVLWVVTSSYLLRTKVADAEHP